MVATTATTTLLYYCLYIYSLTQMTALQDQHIVYWCGNLQFTDVGTFSDCSEWSSFHWVQTSLANGECHISFHWWKVHEDQLHQVWGGQRKYCMFVPVGICEREWERERERESVCVCVSVCVCLCVHYFCVWFCVSQLVGMHACVNNNGWLLYSTNLAIKKTQCISTHHSNKYTSVMYICLSYFPLRSS